MEALQRRFTAINTVRKRSDANTTPGDACTPSAATCSLNPAPSSQLVFVDSVRLVGAACNKQRRWLMKHFARYLHHAVLHMILSRGRTRPTDEGVALNRLRKRDYSVEPVPEPGRST